jgi:peptidoglycan hydrolase-like protein with peptidoglycan-binding domain
VAWRGVAGAAEFSGSTGKEKPMEDKQVAAAARRAGFRGDDLVTAVAVSFAENGARNPAALGDTLITDDKWGPSIGLWQIRSLRNPTAWTGPDRLRDRTKLLDPQQNANVAFKVRAARGWAPWSTYTDGAYLRHLPEARAAVDADARTPIVGRPVLRRYLTLGATRWMRGADVLAVQHRLRLEPRACDGVYGPYTRSAVVGAQTRARIAADGVVGPDTCRVLRVTWRGPGA